MILKAYYSGGRIDVFDTDQLIDCVPQSNNLLTNYTLDLADVNGESLWLRSYYYEAAQAYKDEMAPKDLSVARRRDGWRFLIADVEDLQRLNRLTVDGETVLVKMAEELVDIAALRWAYDIAEEYAFMAVAAHKWLASQDYCGTGISETDICASFGLSPQLYARIAMIAFDPGQASQRF